jgi:hypothetical protein
MLCDIRDHRRRLIDEAIRLKVRCAHFRLVPGEFYRNYITAWLDHILEFTFSQQRGENSWKLAQYGIMRQEVVRAPELDWLQLLLARGCPLDAFAYPVEYEDSEKLLKFVERREANDDNFRLGTFPFDANSAWVDKV